MSDLLTTLKQTDISPQAIPDLFAWYDPSDLTTVTESSGLVSQVADKSPNQFNITQGTGINQPLINTEILGNKKVLDFSNNQWLQNTGISGILNGTDQSITVFSVVKHEQTVSTDFAFSLSDGNDVLNKNFLHAGKSSTGNQFTLSARDTNIVGASNLLIGFAGEYDLQTIRIDHSIPRTQKRLNGICLSSGIQSSLTFENIDTITIGATKRLGTTQFEMLGQIGEIIIYNRGLNDQEVIAIEKYLNNKFGLGIASYSVVEKGLFANYNETTIVTDTGSNVIGWNDKTSNNNDLSKAGDSGTLTRLPNALNGKAGIDFGAGGFTRLVSSDKSTWKFLHNSPCSVFVVCKTASSNPDNFQGIISTSKTTVTDIGLVMAIDDRSGSAVNNKILVNVVNGSALAIDADGGNDSIDLSQANIATYIHIIVPGVDVSSIFINQSTVVSSVAATDTLSSSDPTDFLSIGSESTISEFKGVIVEILIYPRFLSTLEREIVEQFLSDKWGIPLP